MIAKKYPESEQESRTTSTEIKEIIENIKKEFGEDSVTLLGEDKNKDWEVISTGSYLLDQAIGTGGYVCGKIIEIYGWQSSGKSTLALHAVRECQKLGKTAVYFDLENSLDKKYAEAIGVKSKKLIYHYSSPGREVFDKMIKEIQMNVDLIVVDSVSNLVPSPPKGDGWQRIGSQAALMSEGLRRIKPELARKKTIIIFINQLRKNISTTSYFTSPEVTTGGMALGFDADLRIKLKKKGEIKKNEKIIGIEIEAKIAKSKLEPHGEIVNLEIIFPHGIDKSREILELAVAKGIIQKSGTWYSYQEKKLGQGKENIAEYLLENPELYQEIEEKTIKAIKEK